MNYNEQFLEIIWKSVKKGAKLKDVMETYDCTREQAIDMYHQAAQKFGRGPKLTKKVYEPKLTTDDTPKKYERPKPEYSSGYLNILSKYE